MRIAPPKPRPKLAIRDLEIILALASAGSTVRGAALLHLTQSAVSRGLRLAEEKVGHALFERTARGLIPTAVGQRLLTGAPPVMDLLLALERSVTAQAEEPVRLRLACECYTAYRWLPSTLSYLRQSLGNLELTLAPEHTGAPVPALLAGELDVALLTTSTAPTPLMQQPLFADEIVFVLGAAHPLARTGSLTRADLINNVLINSSYTPKAEKARFLRSVFGRARPPRLTHLDFPLTEAMLDAARAGLGIAVLSEWIAAPYIAAGDLVLRRLRGKRLRRPWHIAFRREAEAAAERLRGVLTRSVPHI